MESIVDEVKSLPFPKLMKSNNGNIVLFEKEECGSYVHIQNDVLGQGAKVGEHRTDFYMKVFKDYTGSITLMN